MVIHLSARTKAMTTLYYNLEGCNKVKHHALENNLRRHCPL